MKILFDVVYTNRPRICSTSYLVWELIRKLSEWRDDIFFYVTYPENKMDESDWELFKSSDRVVLLPVPAYTADRMSELFMFREELRRICVPFNVDTWDFDVVVSSRIPMLTAFYPHFAREGGSHLRSLRAVFGLEEMPFLPHRSTVAWSDVLYPQTLESYANSDGVLINNTWTINPLKKVLKDLYSPAVQKKILSNIYEVLPVKVKRLNLKQDITVGDSFNLTFTGRVTGTRNFGQVVDLFRKKFSYPLGDNKNLKFLVSTNSQSLGVSDYGEMDFIDLQYNNREEFYEFLKQAHVSVNLTEVEDFSLATYETLLAGVPIIVLDKEWNSFLGDSYPFRVKNQLEVYALVSEFAKDYKTQYAKFMEWESTYWKSFVLGSANTTTAEKLIELLKAFEIRRNEVITSRGMGGSMLSELDTLIESCGKEINLTEHHSSKVARFKEGDRLIKQSNAISRQCNTLLLKVLANMRGYKDTVVTGVLRKEDS